MKRTRSLHIVLGRSRTFFLVMTLGLTPFAAANDKTLPTLASSQQFTMPTDKSFKVGEFVLLGTQKNYKVAYVKSVNEATKQVEFLDYTGTNLYKRLGKLEARRKTIPELTENVFTTESVVPPSNDKSLSGPPKVGDFYRSKFESEDPEKICDTFRIVATFHPARVSMPSMQGLQNEFTQPSYLLVDRDGNAKVVTTLAQHTRWHPKSDECKKYEQKCSPSRPPDILANSRTQLTESCDSPRGTKPVLEAQVHGAPAAGD